MLLRILTAVVLIPIVVALVWWGPPALLAAVAAALRSSRSLNSSISANGSDYRPIANGPSSAAAAIFYAQFSQGLVETRALGEGVSLVRNAASGVLSIEAVFLIFVFGCVSHRPRHAAPAARSTSLHLHQFCGMLFRRRAVQLSVAYERSRSRRAATCPVHPVPRLGRRHARVFCGQIARTIAYGAGTQPEEDMGRRAGKCGRIAGSSPCFSLAGCRSTRHRFWSSPASQISPDRWAI